MTWSALSLFFMLGNPTLAVPAPDGTKPIIAFADTDYIKNFASTKDGMGCVVFVAFENSAVHAGWTEFRGFAHWCGNRYEGGGYPSKLRRLVRDYCAINKISFDIDVAWSQYEGNNPKWIEAALAMDELPAVTLSRSPRYGKQTVCHMVNCLHLDSKWGCSLDSNFRPAEWRVREDWLRDCPYDSSDKFWGFTVHRK